MSRISDKVKIERILIDNGYYLDKNYHVGGRTDNPSCWMPSWVHKDTNEYLASNCNLEEEFNFCDICPNCRDEIGGLL